MTAAPPLVVRTSIWVVGSPWRSARSAGSSITSASPTSASLTTSRRCGATGGILTRSIQRSIACGSDAVAVYIAQGEVQRRRCHTEDACEQWHVSGRRTANCVVVASVNRICLYHEELRL